MGYMNYKLSFYDFKNFFKNNKNEIVSNNYKMLRLSSLLTVGIGLFIGLINKIFYNYPLWSFFLLFFSLALFYWLSIITEKYNVTFWVANTLTNLYIFVFFTLVILLSILPAKNNQAFIGIYYYSFLIIIPALFLLSILNTLINVVMANILFIMLLFVFKGNNTVFYLEVSYSFFSSLIGILLYFVFSGIRIKDYKIKYILLSQSKKDELSNLPNRRHFNQYLQECYSTCLKENQSLGIVMIDIDDFKDLNDLSGHIFGDVVVRKLGNLLLESSIEDKIFFARYGGDEFIGVFIGFCVEEIKDKMIQISEQLNKMFSQNKTDDITISSGIALLNDESYEELIYKADIALNRAKARGKNCIEIYKENKADERNYTG